MKKAFTLVELLIVIGVLGIVAAILIPELQGHSARAMDTTAKDNLRILRNVVEVYAAQHNGTPPGYLNGDTTNTPTNASFAAQLTNATNVSGQTNPTPTALFPFGPYLPAMPLNPFNDSSTATVLANSDSFPEEAPGDTGWIYKPATKEIRINWPEADDSGTSYYDY
jgi:type IV pilus assembly protein PilA